MIISPAKNCKQIFLKSILCSILLVTIFFIINSFNISKNPAELYADYNIYYTLCVIEILSSVLLGLYIKNKNSKIIIENEEEYKKYYSKIKLITIITIISVILLFFEDIVIPLYYIIIYIYDNTGFNAYRILNLTNVISILICLNIPFLPKSKIKKIEIDIYP